MQYELEIISYAGQLESLNRRHAEFVDVIYHNNWLPYIIMTSFCHKDDSVSSINDAPTYDARALRSMSQVHLSHHDIASLRFLS